MTNLEKIVELTAEACGHAVNSETKFATLKLDSLEFLQLLHDVEQAFNVRIPNEVIAHLDSPVDVCNAVAQLC